MIPLTRSISKFIAAVLRATFRRSSPSAPVTSQPGTASEPPTESAPVGGTIYPGRPEIVYFCGWPQLRLPTGPAAADMLEASRVLVYLPQDHPDRLEMEVRLRKLAGSAETYDAWMRAARFVEKQWAA